MITLLLGPLGWMLLWLGPPAVFAWALYYQISLPMRREERARFFVDLLERGLTDGGTPEQTIVAISRTRDRSVGVRFHLVAAHMEIGLRLGQALERVPTFLPPRVSEVLKIGEEIGDLRSVLPLCRQMLRDGVSQTRGAMNYLILFALAVMPAAPVILHVLATFVFPKMKMILVEMEAPLPPFAVYVVDHAAEFATGFTVVMFGMCLAGFMYVGGPRLARLLRTKSLPLSDWIAYLLPWRRVRMLRDFGSLLSILLDAAVPEVRAVKLAASATANAVFQRRAETVVNRLNQGEKLTIAVRRLDRPGELGWRLDNAAHSPAGFWLALHGWLEALDARAFRLHQTAAQLISTALVLANGALIGSIVVSVFQMVIAIIHSTVLW